MDSEESLEHLRMALKKAEGVVAKEGVSIEKEQNVGHGGRQAAKSRVSLLVLCEIAGVECIAESEGLTEAEAEAFAGDGVDGARGVPDESDVVASDAMESAAESDGTARRSDGSGVPEEFAELREMRECLIDTREFSA